MRLLRPIAEDEMIAVFLAAELDSRRYGDRLGGLLARDGRTEDVVRRRDPDDREASDYRRRLLDEHRGYERREGLFLGFPRQVDWFRAALVPDEVLDILYIDWDWWLQLSGGTRRPRDAARRIRGGEIEGQTAEEDEPIAAALRQAQPPAELIAATTRELTPLVLVEGHVRLTAYALFPDALPAHMEILLGVSDEMPEWCQF
jgi:hypothetical protein